MIIFFKFLIFFVFFKLILPLPCFAVIVLKTKGEEALIHLEGLKTKKGTYFSAVDLYGRERGLVQIKQVAHSKAIAVLKQGTVAKRWSLEPVSRRKAMAIQTKDKRKKARLARMEREKKKRRKALLMARMERKKLKRDQTRKRMERQRRLAQKKQAVRRKIASYDEGEYIINDFPEENNQSLDVLSESSSGVFDHEENLNMEEEESLFPEKKELSKNFIIGLAPLAKYSIMKVLPESSPKYSLRGYAYGASLLVDFPLNHFIRAEGALGYKVKDLFEEEEFCGKSGGCRFKVDYLSAGLSLKLNLANFDRHTLWLAGKGDLFQPLFIDEENNTLTEESFDTIHGSLGLSLGFDLNTGNFVIPISLSGSLYMPPTESVIMGNVGLQVGLAYKF